MSIRATAFFNACKAGKKPKDQKVGDIILAFDDQTIQCWVSDKAHKRSPQAPAVFLFTADEFHTPKQFLFALRRHLTSHNLRLTHD